MESTNIATIQFEETLNDTEIRCFRGAVIDLVGRENSSFHNHLEGQRLAYSYPLVQYKRIDGKLTMVGIDSAAESVIQLASKFPGCMKIGKRSITFHIKDSNMRAYVPIIEVKPKLYSIREYLALTDENFKKYNTMLALTDKLMFLENILVGNILSFLKGLGYHVEEQIFCAITEFAEPYTKYYKGVHFSVFDLKFVSNIELPSGIGLGKSSSVGFGVLKKEHLPNHRPSSIH